MELIDLHTAEIHLHGARESMAFLNRLQQHGQAGKRFKSVKLMLDTRYEVLERFVAPQVPIASLR